MVWPYRPTPTLQPEPSLAMKQSPFLEKTRGLYLEVSLLSQRPLSALVPSQFGKLRLRRCRV